VSSLATEFRPITLADTVGQGPVKAVLKAMVTKDSLPPALIFSGTRGTGKTTTGRTLAAALNCDEGPKTGDCCGNCVSCKSIQTGSSTAVIEVDAASNGTIAEVRKIKDIVQYAAGEARRRVILLDEAHSMSKEAFNALLKVLEEPPPDTVFILLTTEPNKILETVVSRSMVFEFRRIPLADITARLRHICTAKKITASDALLEEIAQRAQGGMRDAIMTLDQASRVGIETVEELHELLGVHDIAVDLLETATRRDIAEGLRLVEAFFFRTGSAETIVSDLTRLTTNLLRLKSGGEATISQPATLERAKNLAAAMEISHLVAVIKVLWDLRQRVRHTDNDQKTTMEAAYILIADAIHPTKVTAAAREIAKAEGSRRLTLAEMRQGLAS
jgi:DNA polymerase-3 subunit gamma/tau